jgi:hypothetical protein
MEYDNLQGQHVFISYLFENVSTQALCLIMFYSWKALKESE